jgi:catechol 2,3-dioxygenase-like lactoylglutathione lyase family enzyme
MMPAKLNIVVIGVHDLPTMREFYESLGWRARPRSGMFARFELDGASMVLFPFDMLKELVGASGEEQSGFGGMVPAMFFDDVSSVEAALAEAGRVGATIVSEISDRPWGVRTAYFSDPEGNVWELACPVSTTDNP